MGVTGVSNVIEVKPEVSASGVKAAIEMALKRTASVDANRIKVETDGDKVTLRGNVGSWLERDEAERAAWAAPGVRIVDDQIMIGAIAASRQGLSAYPSGRAGARDIGTDSGAKSVRSRQTVLQVSAR
jgi:hypothetical protein